MSLQPYPPSRDQDNPAPLTSVDQAAIEASNRYYVRDTQTWAIQNAILSHEQALYLVGEYVMFALMWHLEDFEHGLVGRCPSCFPDSSNLERAVQATYQQADSYRCPDCYGTTFEGGVRALIIRPAIFTDVDQQDTNTARGVVHSGIVNVQSTTDFRVRNGDYVFRGNGERYQLRTPRRSQLRTGFSMPDQLTNAINYALSQATYEDDHASVAYDIGPSNDDLRSILRGDVQVPANFRQFEKINGPLIPDEMSDGD